MRLRWIVCLCLLATLGAAHAQELPEEDASALENADAAQADESQDAAANGDARPEPESAAGGETVKPSAQPSTRSPDTFKPSEEISEDLSVSFPVDI